MVELYENKDISIMCPNCKRFLTKADKRDCRKHILKCRKCGKLISFIPSNGHFEIKEVPKRHCASGVRFY